MAVARVSSKGQVTIPQKVREQFNIRAGDVLLFIEEGGCLRVEVINKRKLTEFYGIFPSNRPPLSMDEMREIVGQDIGRQMNSGGRG